MSKIVNNAGSIMYVDNKVKIRNLDQFEPEYANKLMRVSDGINNYIKDKGNVIEFSPAMFNGTDVVCIRSIDKNQDVIKGFVACIDYDEKPFLRKVYEKIQLLTDGSKPRVETFVKETIKKLEKIGKIH